MLLMSDGTTGIAHRAGISFYKTHRLKCAKRRATKEEK